VIIQVILCTIIYAVIPNLFQGLDSVKYNEKFLIETAPKQVTITTEAITEDVQSGLADYVGQIIEKQQVILPKGILFERIARIDPSDLQSEKVGIGRFEAEVWVLSWFGIDFTHCKKSQLVATRFFFDALFPIVLLVLLSLVTKPVDNYSLNRFFAKMHTPVQSTAEEEERAIEDSFNHPEEAEKRKLFPGSQWELMKPTRLDYIGFGGSWVLVGIVIFLLWLMVTIR
jgi:SSS family solute:Na+ symporter